MLTQVSDFINELYFNLTVREEGQGMVEYALIIALVSIAAMGILLLLGEQVGAKFQEVVTQLGG